GGQKKGEKVAGFRRDLGTGQRTVRSFTEQTTEDISDEEKCIDILGQLARMLAKGTKTSNVERALYPQLRQQGIGLGCEAVANLPGEHSRDQRHPPAEGPMKPANPPKSLAGLRGSLLRHRFSHPLHLGCGTVSPTVPQRFLARALDSTRPHARGKVR